MILMNPRDPNLTLQGLDLDSAQLSASNLQLQDDKKHPNDIYNDPKKNKDPENPS